MSARLAASSPLPPQSSLRHLPADDARVAALLERLAPELAADAARNDVDGRFPHENFARLHRAGLIAQVVPREHGGAGATLAQASRIVAAVARADPATALALVLTMTYLQHRALGRADNRWPAHVRRAVFDSAVAEGALINALRVEPALGSPSRGGLPETIARRDGDGWRLSGHKLYSTGIPALRWLAVWARTDEPEPRVGVFLVPRERDVEDDAGIRVIESWNHLGLRASGSHEVVFDDVRLPADHAVDVRAPDAWAVSAASHADVDAQADQQAWMVALLGSLYDAVARASRDWLLEFATTRAPSGLGAPLATLPRMQEAVGEIEGCLHTNRVLLDEHIARTDGDDERPRQANRDGAGDPHGRARVEAVGQSRAEPPQSARTSLSRRAVQPRAYAAGRCDRGRRRACRARRRGAKRNRERQRGGWRDVTRHTGFRSKRCVRGAA